MYHSKFIILLIVWCYANTVDCTPVALQSKSAGTLTDGLIHNQGQAYLHLLNGNVFLDPVAIKRRKRQVETEESGATKIEENADLIVAPDISDRTVVVTKEIETSPDAQSSPDAVSPQNDPSPQNEVLPQNKASPSDEADDIKIKIVKEPSEVIDPSVVKDPSKVIDPSDEEASTGQINDLTQTISTPDMSEIDATGPMVDTLIPPEISEEPTATGVDTVSTTNTVVSKPDISPDTVLFTPSSDMDRFKIENVEPLETSLDTVNTPSVPTTGDLDGDTTSSDTSSTSNILEEPTETKLHSSTTPTTPELDVLTEIVPNTPEITESTVGMPNTSELEDPSGKTTGGDTSITSLDTAANTEILEEPTITTTSELEDPSEKTTDGDIPITSLDTAANTGISEEPTITTTSELEDPSDKTTDGDASITSLDSAATTEISEKPTITTVDQVSIPNPSELDVPADTITDMPADDTSKTTSDTSSTPEISDEPTAGTFDVTVPSTSELDIPTIKELDISPNSPDQHTTSKSDVKVLPVVLDTPNREDQLSTPEVPPSSTSNQDILGIEETIEPPSTPDIQEEPAADTTSSLGQDVTPDEYISMVTNSAVGQQSQVNSDKQNRNNVADEDVYRKHRISLTGNRCDCDFDEFKKYREVPEVSRKYQEYLTSEEVTIIEELDKSKVESMKADHLTEYPNFRGNYKLPAEFCNCNPSISSKSNDFDDYDVHDSNVCRFNNKKYDSIARKSYNDDFDNVDFDNDDWY